MRAMVIAFVACSLIHGGVRAAEKAAGNGALVVPFANPLNGFDASTIAWSSATGALSASTQYLATALKWDGSLTGRLVYLAIDSYFNGATAYYSHEMAHHFNQKSGTRHFWLDLSDWSDSYPKFKMRTWTEFWDPQELEEYVHSNNPELDARVRKWLILVQESGLYQEKCNARFLAQVSSREGSTTVSHAIAFIVNHMDDAAYNLNHGRDAIWTRDMLGKKIIQDNDITGYIGTMRELGSTISRDDWLITSILTFAASGQTWNSARAAYHYLAQGERRVENLRWPISNRLALSPPNFYLFATYRGLYFESETCIGMHSSSSTINVVLGTGLDSFGLRQTGSADWLRLGGRYDAIPIDLWLARLLVSPYGYANLSRSMKHRGQSVGAEIFYPIGARFTLQGTIEYNKNDMLESIIKNKDEGMYFLVSAGVSLQKGGSAQ